MIKAACLILFDLVGNHVAFNQGEPVSALCEVSSAYHFSRYVTIRTDASHPPIDNGMEEITALASTIDAWQNNKRLTTFSVWEHRMPRDGDIVQNTETIVWKYDAAHEIVSADNLFFPANFAINVQTRSVNHYTTFANNFCDKKIGQYCGRGANVLDFEQYLPSNFTIPLIKIAFHTKLNFEPRALLLSHDLNPGSRFPKSGEDKANRSNSEKKASYARVAHNASEPRHSLLSIKVAFGAIVILGALYFLMNTVPKGHTFKRQTILIYTILGILNVCFGAALIAQALLG